MPELGEIRKAKEVGYKGRGNYWKPIGYFSRFGNALKNLVDLEVKETKLRDFRVVCQKQDELYKLIDNLNLSRKGVE